MSDIKQVTPDQALAEAAAANTTTTKPQPAQSTSQILSVNAGRKTAEPVSSNLVQFNQLVGLWLRANDTSDALKIATSFKNLVDYVLLHQDDVSLLDAWRKLFIKHKDDYLHPEKALRGIDKVTTSEAIRNKISVAYIFMFELVNPKRSRSTYNADFASQVLSNPKCRTPNGYVAYIVERLR